jgi:hypothetical protein
MTFYNAGVQQAEITNFPATQPVSGNVGITGTPNVNVTGNPVVVPKTTMGTITTAAIPTATPFTETAIDFGATMTYTTFRVRVIFDQPVKVEFYHGSSATLTSNKIQRTDTIPANTPTVIHRDPQRLGYGHLHRDRKTGSA